jgi:uncharacterized protein YbjT (DUF2867 family)
VVLVIGATGQQGGAAARALLARGRTVHALVRDPDRPAARELRQAGARLVTGDLDDPKSLRDAMIGVHGVFLMLTPMTGSTVTQAGVVAEERRGTAVADLAAEAGVRHLVYSSVAGANQHTGIPHLESKGRIEAHLRGLGLPATILRPVFFMENFATHTRPEVVAGELVVNLALRPDTSLQLVATRDIGALAAIAIDRPEDFLGRDIVIAGDDLPGVTIAERFGKARGLPARFQQVPLERVRAFDPEVARMFEWFDSGKGERADIPALRALHPDLSTLDTWATERGTT